MLRLLKKMSTCWRLGIRRRRASAGEPGAETSTGQAPRQVYSRCGRRRHREGPQTTGLV